MVARGLCLFLCLGVALGSDLSDIISNYYREAKSNSRPLILVLDNSGAKNDKNDRLDRDRLERDRNDRDRNDRYRSDKDRNNRLERDRNDRLDRDSNDRYDRDRNNRLDRDRNNRDRNDRSAYNDRDRLDNRNDRDENDRLDNRDRSTQQNRNDNSLTENAIVNQLKSLLLGSNRDNIKSNPALRDRSSRIAPPRERYIKTHDHRLPYENDEHEDVVRSREFHSRNRVHHYKHRPQDDLRDEVPEKKTDLDNPLDVGKSLLRLRNAMRCSARDSCLKACQYSRSNKNGCQNECVQDYKCDDDCSSEGDDCNVSTRGVKLDKEATQCKRC